MFARTPRLLLRPGFPEDAPALAVAMGDEQVVRNLGRVPWPYALSDAEAFLARPGDPSLPASSRNGPDPRPNWSAGADSIAANPAQ